jgi:glycerate 2-kinase
MPLNVLIIPDKFKGTLSANAAAAAIAKGWQQVRSQDRVTLLPMSDGGDGFGEVLGKLLQAKLQKITTVDAAHRPCRASWWWEPRTRTAVIESARVVGLAMLPPNRFHPFQLDTFGLGTLLRAAATKRVKRCIMGIGGSATNDGGFGLAVALGWEFFTRQRKSIQRWIDLETLDHIAAPLRQSHFDELIVAVDVQNPLLGLRGATKIYGPQKGLQPDDFALAERCLGRLARIFKRDFGSHLARSPGAGAAGGLGFGLMAFAGARLAGGFELFSEHAGLKERVRAADLIITAEGGIDQSTLMGKGVGQIAKWTCKLGIPCIGLAGTISNRRDSNRAFTDAYALTDFTSLDAAKAKPAFWLQHAATRAAQNLEQ